MEDPIRRGTARGNAERAGLRPRTLVSALIIDVKYALRGLRRSPRDTWIAVATLALGIGASTAMFSAVNHVLWRPFPFRDEARLIRLREMSVDTNGHAHPYNMSSRAFLAVRAKAGDVLDGLVAMSGQNMTLLGGDVAERVSVVLQSEGFENTLDVKPVLGRALTIDEERRGIDSGVALVSHAMWQSRFGGMPSVLGTTVRLDDRAFTIVGVMPPQYAFPYLAQFWIPWRLDTADQSRDFAVWGHLRRGVTDRQLRESMDRVAAGLRRDYAALPPTYSLEIRSIRENLMGDQQRPLVALSESVTLMLLLASVNVATLLLARSVARRREFAIRLALGQSHVRAVGQQFVESATLAAIGCAGGLILTMWVATVTARLVPTVLTGQLGLTTPEIDWRVAMFAVAASLISATVAGVMPAVATWQTPPRAVLNDGTRTMSIGRRQGALLGVLIVVETALTVVLMATGGLVIRNFVRLQARPLGFDPHGLLAIELTPPPERYGSPDKRSALARDVVAAARNVAGATRAAITTVNPLGGGTWAAPMLSEDAARRSPDAAFNANYRLVSPGLFSTMGIALQRGRDFSGFDRRESERVVIVSARLANRVWPNQDAIGRRIRFARPDAAWLRVVGIVDNVDDAHDPGVPTETVYVPYEQAAQSAAAEHLYIMVRVNRDPLSVVTDVRRAIASLDQELAPYAPVAMDTYRSEALVRERVSAGLMIGFCAFGLLLGALGVYGVISLTVAERSPEFGVRVALGARMWDVVRLAVGRTMMRVVAGICVGTVAALGLNRVVAGLLADGGAVDARMITAAATLITVAALAACAAPAIAIGRLNPVAVLRN